MIDPFQITNYARSDEDLQEFWLFCLAVAGKTATQMAKKVDDFLQIRKTPNNLFRHFDHFDWITAVGGSFANHGLVSALTQVKMGKYGLLTKGYLESARRGTLYFRTASADDIAADIPGAGLKTSRFFTLHSRLNEQVAVIDTHMLKYLRQMGVAGVPDTIPTGKKYLALEKILLAEAAKKQMAMADFDLAIWSHYASGGKSALP